MVEINENNVNTTENRTEMTMKEEETTDKKVVEDVSIKNNNNEHAATTMTTTTTINSTEGDNISRSVSIDDEKNNLSIKRIIQIIGEGHSKKNNNVAENSKIKMNDNVNLLIHEFDATTEDPFTLESFDTLIQQHSDKDKDFIIARVTTVDPSDESKTYHSYYSGHHINKVLFRTQPDQGLLHRMKAKNPLNNMNIIGDVHYYVVKASSVKKLPTFAKSSSMSTTSKKTLKINGDSAIMATSPLDKVEEKDFTKINIDNIDDIRSNSNKLRSAPPSIWNVERNDDDEKFAIEMESSSNNKRWSADDSLKPLPKAITANHNSSTSSAGENFERLLTTFKLQTFNNHNDNENNSQSSKIIIPPLVNNEISVSISHNDLKEQQIDSPVTLTQSLTKDSHSISINEEDGVEDGTIYYKAKFYATDDDFLMHSAIRHFFKANALESIDAQLFTINTSSHNNPNMNVTPSARLERIVTGHETYLLDPMVIGNMRSPILTRSVDSSESNAVPTSRWRRAINNMKMNKGLRWLVLMYMIFGFLLIRFVVAETYAYLMAFLLMLCLFLVFCVGSGVGIWGR